MNSSNKSFNYEAFLQSIGSIPLVDGLYLFLVLPTSIIGFFSNTFSLFIFFDKDFKNITIFKYMKFYIINCLVSGIIASINSFSFSPRYFGLEVAIGDLARIYKCKLLPYVVSSILFHRHLMDCAMSAERLSNLTVESNLKHIIESYPYIIGFISLFFSFLTGVPTYFELTIKPYSDFESLKLSQDLAEQNKFQFCGRDQFFSSRNGKYILLLLFIIREVLTLIIELTLSFITLIYMKKYINKRNVIVTYGENQEILRKIKAEKKNEIKIYLLVLYFSTFSIICHSISLSLQIAILLISNTKIIYHLLLLNFMIYSIRNASNFLFYYFLNNKFKQKVKSFFHKFY